MSDDDKGGVKYMKHLGDITKISGYTAPVVDVVCGGSPCQDLSVAGLRKGISGERSGLFMDQIRIIKEMREHDRAKGRSGVDVRCRWCIWENVPGAASSNQGRDYQKVLTEFVRVARPDAPDVPMPAGGRWPKSGVLYGVGTDGTPFSVAWRHHNAMHYGVAQRRERICVLCDYGGNSAGEILLDLQFWGDAEGVEPEEIERRLRDGYAAGEAEAVHAVGQGVSGYPRQSKSERQGPSGSSAACTGGTVSRAVTLKVRGRVERDSAGKKAGKGALVQDELSGTLGVSQDQSLIAFGIGSYDSNAMKSANPDSGIYKADTARTLDLNGGNPGCNQDGMAVVYDGCGITSPGNKSNPQPGDPCHALHQDDRNYVVAIEGNGARESHKGDGYAESDTMYTLNTVEQHAVCCSGDTAGTLDASYGKGCGERNGVERDVVVCLNDQGGSQMGVSDGVSGSLRAEEHGQQPLVFEPGVAAREGGHIYADGVAGTVRSNPGDNAQAVVTAAFCPEESEKTRSIGYAEEQSPSLRAGTIPACYDARGNGDGNVSPTITGNHENRVTDYSALVTGPLMASGYAKNGTQEAANGMYVVRESSFGQYEETEVGGTLKAVGGVLGGGSESFVAGVDVRCGTENIELNGTLQAKDGGYNYTRNNVLRQRSIVRRLTPEECEALQGFPRGWTQIGEPEEITVNDYETEFNEEGDLIRKRIVGSHKEIAYFYRDSNGRKKRVTDSARYKALGNSIAVGYANRQSGFWCWLARRICAQYERQVTMASLFDGIGGFPLAFSACGAIPVWASEIEEFPIAVTKIRFPEVES